MFRPADPDVPSDDELLAELARDSAGTGPDIVATIRAAQDEVVRTPAGRLLIVQGGPGTGKTLTALRRVAWLIDEGLVDDDEALVVGPSPAFAEYTSDVLTRWGYDRVEHRTVADLLTAPAGGGRDAGGREKTPGWREKAMSAPGGREEAAHVTRLKGEARMVGLLSRAVDDFRARSPADLPATISIGGRGLTLDPAALQRVIATARASNATLADRRRILRAVLAAGTDDPRLILDAADLLAHQLWPEPEPTAFLRDLFGSRDLLTSAAGGEFTDREIAALYRAPSRRAEDESWSDADLPLLDEVDQLAGRGPKTYAHVVVDEAQDLSPMQVRAVSRRSASGAMTIVGDIAQSTGPWARDDWHDLHAQLPSAVPHEHRELRFVYRVPRQIFVLAAELLPMAAPSVPAPTAVRDGPAEPVVMPASAADRAAVVAGAAAAHAAEGRSVAVVCPARCRDEIERRLPTEGDITLLSPHEAKGLEADAAVVVEPGHILDDDPRGHRLLYIALTRATSHLHLVGAPADLPAEFAPQAPPPARPRPADPVAHLDPAVRENIDMAVRAMAETLLATLSPALWPVALRRLEQLISPDD